MPQPPPVTLQHIARAAGVHVSTVSLAVRSSPKLAPATGERLRSLARELGYRRDPVLLALSGRRQSRMERPVIVFLTNRPSTAEFRLVPHMPAFYRGVREQAVAMGFDTALRLIRSEADADRIARSGFDRAHVQGVILGAFLPHWPGVAVDALGCAVVKIDSHYLRPSDVPRISFDQAQIVRTAYARLHQLGNRRIGMAVGQFDEDGADECYSASMLLEQHLLGLPRIPALHFAPLETPAVSARRLGVWVRRHQLDAVMSNWGSLRDLLRQAGLRVPQQVACAGLCLSGRDPAQAGVVVDHAQVGRKAVETIAHAIRIRAAGPASGSVTLIGGVWHDGSSTPTRR